jgi:HEAT repeat protein
MDDEEISDFLDIIRTESAKQADESDVVNALWLKDFPNLQYYAPEEFIESRILEERTESLTKRGLQIIPQELAGKVVDIKVDRQQLFSGRLELRPEEKQAINAFVDEEVPELPENWQQNFAFEAEGAESGTGTGQVDQPANLAVKLPVSLQLTEEELSQLNRLLERNRKLSPEEEFINLMLEIMALEDNEKQFETNLNILEDFYLENIKNGHFNIPIILNRKIKELRTLLASSPDDRPSQLDAFLARTADLKILDEIRKLVDNKVQLNYEALYEYLVQFEEAAVPFLAEMYEKVENQAFRNLVRGFFQEKMATDPGLVASQLDEQKPQLTSVLIDLMEEQPAKKIIPYFTSFLAMSSRELKLKAVEALASFNDELANKILMAFMNDKDQEVRLKATTNLKFLGDTSRLGQLMAEVFTPKFRARSFEEKKALFEFLGRTKSEEAFKFLKKIFLKKSWRRSTTELKICAVAGLEKMGSKEAIDLLRRGEHFFNRQVREASAEALVRLALKNS